MEPQDRDFDDFLKLSIDADRINAILYIEPDQTGEPITQDLLCEYLAQQEIDEKCVLYDAIDRLIEAIGSDPTEPHEMIVATGKPAVHAQGASIKFSEIINARIDEIAEHAAACLDSQDKPGAPPSTSDDEAIDFHAQSPFLIVSAAQLIGQMVESTQGMNGYDLTGQVIEASAIEGECELFDESIKKDADGNLHTLISGRLIYDSDYIEVQSTLDIPTNVDFSTGNIDFPNDVLVHEGVHDQFCVKAGGNIEICKLVQASTLIAANDIELKSGMAGRETGTITTGGDLKAKYLDGVHGSIGGHCEITKEITNCHLTVHTEIQSPGAVIRGGEICAIKGGIVNSIGSEQGVETDIIIGWIPALEEKCSAALRLQSQIKSTISKQTQELDMFKGSIGKPSEFQQKQIEEMESELSVIQENLGDLDTAIDRLRGIIAEHTAYSLTVKSTIYAKSRVWLPGYRVCFDKDVRGELTIEFDEHHEPIIIRNGTSAQLSSVAKVRKDERVLAISVPKPIEPTLSVDEPSDDAQSDEDLQNAA